MMGQEFITLAVAHLLAVASPGPDFFFVSKVSLSQGRRAGYMGAIGIGVGILFHVVVALFGFATILQQVPLLFRIIQAVGALYLIYLGILAIRTPAAKLALHTQHTDKVSTSWTTFTRGVLTNATNPKATLFFFFLFTQVVSTDTTFLTKIAYGGWIWAITTVWFLIISHLLSSHQVKSRLLIYLPLIDKILGGVLTAIGIKIISGLFAQL